MIYNQYKRYKNTYADFPEGLSVLVPGRIDVEIVRKPYGSPLKGSFKVIRPLVNFEIIDLKGNQDDPFNHPVELLVRFTEDDVAQAEGNPKFIYYKDNKDKWVMPEDQDDNVEIDRYWFGASDGFVGFDVIKLPGWPADPSGAWGV